MFNRKADEYAMTATDPTVGLLIQFPLILQSGLESVNSADRT